MKIPSMKKIRGLRKRWLINTAGVVFLLGLVCVMAVTASFAAYYYSNMQADMENRADAMLQALQSDRRPGQAWTNL